MPSFPNNIDTGIPYRHYDETPRDFGDVTDSYEYEDAGRDFNRRTSSPPRVWNIEFKNHLNKAQTDQFDEFWETVGVDVPFTFTDKYGDTYGGVRVKSYSRSHDAHKAWDKKVAFTLVQYVAADPIDVTPPETPGAAPTLLSLGATSIRVTWGALTDPGDPGISDDSDFDDGVVS